MAQITKDTKNIIEAGITPEEYARIADRRIPMDSYLRYWPEQSERYYHLGELAEMRGDKKLGEYFKSIGSYPAEYWSEDEV